MRFKKTFDIDEDNKEFIKNMNSKEFNILIRNIRNKKELDEKIEENTKLFQKIWQELDE